MAKTDYKTVDEYHEAFPTEIRTRMQAIRDLVHEVAPNAEEVISYQIPAFKVGKKFLIYYSAYAKHISLSSPWSDALLKHFAPQLKELKVSKSAIQLPNDKPLPLDFAEQLLRFRKQELSN